MRFLVDLFCNWLDAIIKPAHFRVHNTQVLRYVQDLRNRGWVRATGSGQKSRYTLTRLGLLELIQELSNPSARVHLEEFIFAYYFLSAYGARIVELIRREGSGFSRALQLEVSERLEPKRFIRARLETLEYEIKRLKLRMRETDETVELATKLARQGESIDIIVAQTAARYPYELHAQKPMTDLMREIPAELRFWELTEGNRFRVKLMWAGVLRDLERQIQILRELTP
ncbi:MAG: hypothetical protein AB7G93_08710 [Bdellovibrionales bacterium]